MIESTSRSIIDILLETRRFYGNRADESLLSPKEAISHLIATQHFALLENLHTVTIKSPLQSDSNVCYTGEIPSNTNEIIFSQFLSSRKIDHFIGKWIDSILKRSFIKMCHTTQKKIETLVQKNTISLACILFSPKTGLLYAISHMMHIDLLFPNEKFLPLTPISPLNNTIYCFSYRSPPFIPSFTILMRGHEQALSLRVLRQNNCPIRQIALKKTDPENLEKFWIYNVESYSSEDSSVIHHEERPGKGLLFGIFDGRGSEEAAIKSCEFFAKNFFSTYFPLINQTGGKNFSLHCQSYLEKKTSKGFVTASYLFAHDDGTFNLASSGHESIYLVYRNDFQWSITPLVNKTTPETLHRFKDREGIEKAIPCALGHINANRTPLFSKVNHPPNWHFLVISSERSHCTPLKLHVALTKMETIEASKLVDQLANLSKEQGAVIVISKKKFAQPDDTNCEK